MVALEVTFLVGKPMCITVHVVSSHKGIPFSTTSLCKIQADERVMEKPVDKEVFSACLACVVGS